MIHPEKPGLRGQLGSIVLAVGTTATATALIYLLPALRRSPSPVFMASVMISAFYGDLIAGLLATAASAIVLESFLTPHIHSLDAGLAGMPRLVSFVSVAILVNWLNSRRQDLEKRLRDADRRKDQFLAILAHELRGCLGPVLTASDILSLRGESNDAAGQARQLIKRQASNASRIVSDLLDVARIKEGKFSLTPQVTDLKAIVSHAIEDTRASAGQRGLQLHLSVPDDPVMVKVDPIRFEQVLANLLTNAVKYTDAGGHIWLTIKQDLQDVLISVKDTGCGISPTFRSRVFELYGQVNEGGQEGLGIGLYLVRLLVEGHGGTVRVHCPAEGKGTEFIIRLPRRDNLSVGPQGAVAIAAPRRVHAMTSPRI